MNGEDDEPRDAAGLEMIGDADAAACNGGSCLLAKAPADEI